MSKNKIRAGTVALSLMLAANGFPVMTSALGQLNPPGCVPVGERNGREVGCYILLSEHLGEIHKNAVFWSLYNFSNRAAAEAVKQPGETVFESLGKIWLSHIGDSGWEVKGGERVAEIGPLHVKPGVNYHAMYMEAIFRDARRRASALRTRSLAHSCW
jgi:hypothetical protein